MNKKLKEVPVVILSLTCVCFLTIWLNIGGDYGNAKCSNASFAHSQSSSSQLNALSPTNREWKTIHVYAGPAVEHGDSFRSYSQLLQDTVIQAIFPSKGFFIDLAANEWQYISNTYSLETYAGWDGICIEPNSFYWEGHLKRRCTLIGAVVSTSKNELVHFSTNNGAMGGIVSRDTDNKPTGKIKSGGVKRFHTVDILEVFRKFSVPQIIQYVSLDIEGAEERIIESFPFDTYTISALSIERPNKNVLAILKKQNFVEIGVLGNFGEVLYLNNKIENFMEKLKLGQIEVTKIEKKLESVAENDILPLKNRKGMAQGVRCPYYKLKLCHKDLLHYTATYEEVLSRLN